MQICMPRSSFTTKLINKKDNVARLAIYLSKSVIIFTLRGKRLLDTFLEKLFENGLVVHCSVQLEAVLSFFEGQKEIINLSLLPML